LSARGTDQLFLKNSIEAQIIALHKLIGDHIKEYEDEDPIEVQIAKLLITQKETLATAESCTGGKLAAIFTTNPGASACFKAGLVSYATETKTAVLGVPEALIKKHSVVSEEVATAMAKNAQKLFKTSYAIATTGNAGPTKGDSDAEIGTVFIAL